MNDQGQRTQHTREDSMKHDTAHAVIMAHNMVVVSDRHDYVYDARRRNTNSNQSSMVRIANTNINIIGISIVDPLTHAMFRINDRQHSGLKQDEVYGYNPRIGTNWTSSNDTRRRACISQHQSDCTTKCTEMHRAWPPTLGLCLVKIRQRATAQSSSELSDNTTNLVVRARIVYVGGTCRYREIVERACCLDSHT